MRVRLVVPDAERWRSAAAHGEHYGYHGQAGTVLCGAGNGGVWVRFDSQAASQYVGCPLAWLWPEQ